MLRVTQGGIKIFSLLIKKGDNNPGHTHRYTFSISSVAITSKVVLSTEQFKIRNL